MAAPTQNPLTASYHLQDEIFSSSCLQVPTGSAPWLPPWCHLLPVSPSPLALSQWPSGSSLNTPRTSPPQDFHSLFSLACLVLLLNLPPQWSLRCPSLFRAAAPLPSPSPSPPPALFFFIAFFWNYAFTCFNIHCLLPLQECEIPEDRDLVYFSCTSNNTRYIVGPQEVYEWMNEWMGGRVSACLIYQPFGLCPPFIPPAVWGTEAISHSFKLHTFFSQPLIYACGLEVKRPSELVRGEINWVNALPWLFELSLALYCWAICLRGRWQSCGETGSGMLSQTRLSQRKAHAIAFTSHDWTGLPSNDQRDEKRWASEFIKVKYLLYLPLCSHCGCLWVKGQEEGGISEAILRWLWQCLSAKQPSQRRSYHPSFSGSPRWRQASRNQQRERPGPGEYRPTEALPAMQLPGYQQRGSSPQFILQLTLVTISLFLTNFALPTKHKAINLSQDIWVWGT